MIYGIGNSVQPPMDTPIWACAYDTNYTEKGMLYKKEPVLGKIVIEKGSRYFYEFKKNGFDIKKSSKVNMYARRYSDTYEESVELYNRLVNHQIKKLEDLIANHKKDVLI